MVPAESLNTAFLERMVTVAIVAFEALLLFLGALFIELVTTASEADIVHAAPQATRVPMGLVLEERGSSCDSRDLYQVGGLNC